MHTDQTTPPPDTIEALDAALDAGTIGHRDHVRAMRRDHRAAYDARQIERRHVATVERNDKREADDRAHAYRYSDAGLAETIARGEDAAPGPYRVALILQNVHPDDRAHVVADARRFSNATPDAGRWSDSVRSCSNDPHVRRVA